MNKLLPILFLILVLIPVFVFAQGNGQLIPKCSPNCGFYDLLQLVNNIINWVIMISFPIAAGVFAWAGFVLMTSADNSGKRSEAKKMFWKVFIGFAFILSAWIIVGTITNSLLQNPSIVPVDTRP